MLQVNLITQLFADVDPAVAASAAGKPPALPGTGDAGFMLLLQQQLWASGLPQFGQTDASLSGEQSAGEAGFAAFLAGLESNSPMDVVSLQTSPTASTEVQSQGLLQALLTSLQQVLDAGSPSAAATAQLAVQDTAGDLAEGILWPQAGSVPSSTDVGVVAAPSDSLATQYPVLALADAWQPAISRLNALLEQATGMHLRVSTSMCQFDVPGNIQRLPGALLGNPAGEPNNFVQETEAQTVAWPVETGAASTVGLGTIPSGDAELPQAVHWFIKQGLLGNGKAEPTGAAKPDGREQTAAQLAFGKTAGLPADAKALSGLVQLAGGETAKLTLVEAAQAGPVTQYAVMLEAPGEPGAVLTATLSVERAPAPVMLNSIDSPSPHAMQRGSAAETAFQVFDLGARAIAGQEAPSPVVETVPTQQTHVQPAEPELKQQASAAQLEPARQAVKAAAILPPESELLREGVVKTTSPVGVSKQTSPVTLEQAADKLAAVMEMSSAKEAATTKLVDHTLKLDAQPAPASFAAEFTPLQRLAKQSQVTSIPLSLHVDGLGMEANGQLFATNANLPLPMSMLQFTQPETPVSQFTSLNYLDLAQRVMDEAAQARQSGDGVYTAKLNLNPPNLGQLSVNIAVHGETVALQLAVASSAPKSKLDDSLAQLKQSLEDAGLEVVELRVVQTSNQGEGEHTGEDQPQQRQSEKRHAAHKQATFMAAPFTGRAAQAVPAVS